MAQISHRTLAERVATELTAEHIRISGRKPITMGSIVMDMVFSRTPEVQPAPDLLRQYDFLLFFGPVWMGQAASPLWAYFNALKQNPKPYGFLSISGGTDGGNPKLTSELLRRTGKQPSILIDQHIAELLSPDHPTTRKETSAYRLKEDDVARLAQAAVEGIQKALQRRPA